MKTGHTDESGYYMDEFDYCLGNFAEDLLWGRMSLVWIAEGAIL